MHEITRTCLRRHARLVAGLALTVLMLSACASTPPAPPTGALAAARQAIDNAEKSDAQEFAAAELGESRERLSRAERAVTAENMIMAERLAQESRIGAELASARTESIKAAEVNREMSRSADALRDEMRRTGDQL